MEPLPFNACDYRCERCLETGRCALFCLSSEREEPTFSLRRDPDVLDAAFRDLGEIFGEGRAEELCLDIDERMDTGLRDRSEEAKQDPLYLSAHEFLERVRDFLKCAEPLVVREGADFLEDIRWHHTIIPVKIFRAMRSAGRPEMAPDAVNSAAVARKSLTISAMAFDTLGPLYPTLAGECKRLSWKAVELKQYVDARFRGKV